MPDDTKAADPAAEKAKSAGEKPADAKPDTKAADPAAEKAPGIDPKVRTDLLRRARLAGATENSLTELGDALNKAPADAVRNFEQEIAKLRKKNRKTFHVASEGAVMYDGERYESGENLLLTEQEAAELGAAVVQPGNAPPAPVDVAKRRAGKYRVREERNVLSGGKYHGPGDVLELTESDARSLGDYVEEA